MYPIRVTVLSYDHLSVPIDFEFNKYFFVSTETPESRPFSNG